MVTVRNTFASKEAPAAGVCLVLGAPLRCEQVLNLNWVAVSVLPVRLYMGRVQDSFAQQAQAMAAQSAVMTSASQASQAEATVQVRPRPLVLCLCRFAAKFRLHLSLTGRGHV